MRRYAYADPPYPGQARKHYHNDPSGIAAVEVDHAALIARLCDEYPDGWALSTSSSALQAVLALCPSDVRIAAWVKPFASFKPGDMFYDLFPGSRSVGAAWERWQRQLWTA